MSSSGDGDIFPPNRTRRISSSSPSRLPEDAVESWQHEYEDVLEDVFGVSEEHGLYGSLASWGPLAGALADLNVNGDAWLFGEGDDFSDVSSIASIGELGGRARLDDGEEDEDEDDDDDDDEIARPPRSPVDEVEADEDADDDDNDKADPEDPNRNNWEVRRPPIACAPSLFRREAYPPAPSFRLRSTCRRSPSRPCSTPGAGRRAARRCGPS